MSLLEDQGDAVIGYCERDETVQHLFTKVLVCVETLLMKGLTEEKPELAALASALQHAAQEACKESLSEQNLADCRDVENRLRLQEAVVALKKRLKDGQDVAENSAEQLKWLKDGIKDYAALLPCLSECEKIDGLPISKCVLESGKKLKGEMQVLAQTCTAFMLNYRVEQLKSVGHGGPNGQSWRQNLTKGSPWPEIVQASTRLVSLEFADLLGNAFKEAMQDCPPPLWKIQKSSQIRKITIQVQIFPI